MEKLVLVPKYWLEESQSLLGALNPEEYPVVAAEHHIKLQFDRLGIPYRIIDSPQAPNIDQGEYVINGKDFSKEYELAEFINSLPNTHVPNVVGFDDFEREPFFPVMVKCEKSSGGELQYVITDEKQWKKLKVFLLKGVPVGKLDNKDKARLRSESGLDSCVPGTQNYKNAKKEYDIRVGNILNPLYNQTHGKNFFSFQEFIECPSEYYTSYRLIVSAHGNIIAASLLHSQHKKSEGRTLTRDTNLPSTGEFVNFWGRNTVDFLVDPKSKVYLGALDVRSNIGQGGSGIVLNPGPESKSRSEEENKILIDHGIDPDYPQIPEELVNEAKVIGSTIGRRRGLFVGIDFIQGVDGKYYYLETNNGPGLQTYLDAKNDGAGSIAEATAMIYAEVLPELLSEEIIE